jgi:threonine dehydrogenase-like Zn-dependent dehydrogenase
VPDGLTDDQVLFLSDIFPTGWMAAENADIQPGQTVLVFGCGPVGQFAIRSAFMMGAERVIAIDQVPERLQMARDGGAETIDFSEGDLQDRIKEMTHGRGPDAVIEAVGLESHGAGSLIEKVQETVAGKMERSYALNEAIIACRPGGTISLPGVFIGPVPTNMGAFVAKGLTMRTGQTHTQRYLEPLMRRIAEGEIDPSFLITHKIRLEDGPDMYKTFQEKKDGCVKIVINP